MRLRRRIVGGAPVVEAAYAVVAGWRRLSGAPAAAELLAAGAPDDTVMSFLQLGPEGWDALTARAGDLPTAAATRDAPVSALELRSFRDFMLYEKHVIDASRGMVRRFMPGVARIAGAVERVTGKPFSKFKPHALWYKQPIYYFGNHLNVLTDGDPAPWPAYSSVMDYELEIGAILAQPLLNATADEAAAAIGGFVVLNDFSARDVQIPEMQSGFGPQKAKHFCSAISAEVVTADEVLPHLDALSARVEINGVEVAKASSAGPQFSLPEAIAQASTEERLHPGEMFGSGTLPGAAGVENGALPKPGDEVALFIDKIGSVTNRFEMTGEPR